MECQDTKATTKPHDNCPEAEIHKHKVFSFSAEDCDSRPRLGKKSWPAGNWELWDIRMWTWTAQLLEFTAWPNVKQKCNYATAFVPKVWGAWHSSRRLPTPVKQ